MMISHHTAEVAPLGLGDNIGPRAAPRPEATATLRSRLFQRGQARTWCYRRRVPADLRELDGRGEIVISLRTANRARAELDACRAEASIDLYFVRLRAGACEGYKPLLHFGDYRELAPQLIEPGSVDLILTDPPYARSRSTATAHSWDQPIDLEELWSVMLPLLADDGTVIITACQPFTTDLINSQRGLFRYTAVWNKVTPSRPHPTRWLPLKAHEDIVVFSRRNANYTRIAHPRRDGRTDTVGGGVQKSRIYGKSIPTLSAEGARRQPTTVITTPRVLRSVHGTEKPIQLLLELILRHSLPGALILDPYAGSGSTLQAAWLAGRRSVGFEADRSHFEAASARLAKAVEVEAGVAPRFLTEPAATAISVEAEGEDA